MPSAEQLMRRPRSSALQAAAASVVGDAKRRGPSLLFPLFLFVRGAPEPGRDATSRFEIGFFFFWKESDGNGKKNSGANTIEKRWKARHLRTGPGARPRPRDLCSGGRRRPLWPLRALRAAP